MMLLSYHDLKKGGIARNARWLALLKIFRSALKKSFLATKDHKENKGEGRRIFDGTPAEGSNGMGKGSR
jgi:hypothetical protein